MAKKMITNKKELAAELARRCSDSDNFEGDLNVAQAAHALRCLRDIAGEMEQSMSASTLAGIVLGFEVHTVAVRCDKGEADNEG